jgi:hypothetical protein
MCETFVYARSLLLLLAAIVLTAAACGGEDDITPTPIPQRTATLVVATATTARSPTATSTAPPTAAPIDPGLPTGFPLDPEQRTDRVTGAVGARHVEQGGGAAVRHVSAGEHVADDPVVANTAGWNCRTHVEYEGVPAVDWYVRTGTPVYATMDGEAILMLNTVANAFDYYNVSREPYLGNPDRSRASVTPFSGPGGGMGLYVVVLNEEFRTEYGHFDLAATVAAVPASAFVAPYSPSYGYATDFATPMPVTFGAQIATWTVRKGDLIGYTGDSGYSEAPHLHYRITRRATGETLCPTAEAGFAAGGWLFR